MSITDVCAKQMQQSYPDHRKHERNGIKHTSLPKDLNKQNEDGSFITSVGMVNITTGKDFLVVIISLSFAYSSNVYLLIKYLTHLPFQTNFNLCL